MPTILSLETATNVCSVALTAERETLVNLNLSVNHAHSEKITLLISDCLRYAGLTWAHIDAIAVGKGPGSYTGLRIGVATAKGLCFALDKPLVAINTLESMAYQVANQIRGDYWMCPVIDARRMEVYCAIYDQHLRTILPTSAKVIDEQSFEEQLSQQSILFFGNGAAKCKPKLAGHPQALFARDIVHPSAKAVGILAEQAFSEGRFENLAYFEPFYLKEFVTTVARSIGI